MTATCSQCGATMSQRALYQSTDYGHGRYWYCRSPKACARRMARVGR